MIKVKVVQKTYIEINVCTKFICPYFCFFINFVADVGKNFYKLKQKEQTNKQNINRNNQEKEKQNKNKKTNKTKQKQEKNKTK